MTYNLLLSKLAMAWTEEVWVSIEFHERSCCIIVTFCLHVMYKVVEYPGGSTFANIVCGCAYWTSKNLTFSIPIFCTIIHQSVYQFQKKSIQFCSNWVLFYHSLLKIHPDHVIWAPSSLMKTHRLLYQISGNSTPKGRHIYVMYNMSI